VILLVPSCADASFRVTLLHLSFLLTLHGVASQSCSLEERVLVAIDEKIDIA